MSHRRPAARTTLFVAGFPPTMRARDLAYEFERMGRLVRCDIPALRSPNATPYAFVEYEDPRDAEAAHHDMHGMRFGRHALAIQFAKNAPSSNWRFDGPSRRGPPPPPVSSAPPPLSRNDLTPAEQEEADRAAEERARARAAARERERSRSPSRRRDDGDYADARRSTSRRVDDGDYADARRSTSRRVDDGDYADARRSTSRRVDDFDDERRRRYDDEDRGRERSYGGENGTDANGDRKVRERSDDADAPARDASAAAFDEPAAEEATAGGEDDAARAVSRRRGRGPSPNRSGWD